MAHEKFSKWFGVEKNPSARSGCMDEGNVYGRQEHFLFLLATGSSEAAALACCRIKPGELRTWKANDEWFLDCYNIANEGLMKVMARRRMLKDVADDESRTSVATAKYILDRTDPEFMPKQKNHNEWEDVTNPAQKMVTDGKSEEEVSRMIADSFNKVPIKMRLGALAHVLKDLRDNGHELDELLESVGLSGDGDSTGGQPPELSGVPPVGLPDRSPQ